MLKNEFVEGPKKKSSLDFLSESILNKVSFSSSNSSGISKLDCEESFKPIKKKCSFFIYYFLN